VNLAPCAAWVRNGGERACHFGAPAYLSRGWPPFGGAACSLAFRLPHGWPTRWRGRRSGPEPGSLKPGMAIRPFDPVHGKPWGRWGFRDGSRSRRRISFSRLPCGGREEGASLPSPLRPIRRKVGGGQPRGWSLPISPSRRTCLRSGSEPLSSPWIGNEKSWDDALRVSVSGGSLDLRRGGL